MILRRKFRLCCYLSLLFILLAAAPALAQIKVFEKEVEEIVGRDQGQKQPNGLGLYDMTGNVWEWCQDWYGGRYYAESPRDNPLGPPSGQSRVLRGGSWGSFSRVVRAAIRDRNAPAYRSGSSGFRLSLSAP
ncbi:MAG: SUMF1/EgtB/PvdO family nonheme iron enzyme [Smithellaceae bacterium]|nr:SUMF1/EgtB/PvdO family nonheme iron enzyme [Smithellaceae bacterium]